MPLRGQNLLGYRHFMPMMWWERFVERAVNGMDVFRVFDAMNDPGAHESGASARYAATARTPVSTLSYTPPQPAHTLQTGWI
ncbi:hypothetical protein KCP76_13795 [Salmonella enterica subsp. enterica serovar Weltevreden]|nr:hypothetical protein KCP76_13795 [Salmonella enterica subsp. enterica serovar Weltevreden]